jgi:hypothetical protein
MAGGAGASTLTWRVDTATPLAAALAAARFALRAALWGEG